MSTDDDQEDGVALPRRPGATMSEALRSLGYSEDTTAPGPEITVLDCDGHEAVSLPYSEAWSWLYAQAMGPSS